MSMTPETNEIQIEEWMKDYDEIAKLAKYPPFSVPDNDKENGFLVALAEEFDRFVEGQKSYDSFDAFLIEYAEEMSTAMAWSTLGYSPEQAAKEYLKKLLQDKTDDAETADRISDVAMRDGTVKKKYFGIETFEPWEVI